MHEAVLLVPAAMLAGGFLYRMRGGFGPDFPRPIDQMLFSLPCLIVPGIAGAGWWALLAYVWAVAWECSGHGKHMDLGSYPYPAEDEKLTVLVKWLEGRVPEYWYDVAGVTATGLVPTLLPGLIIAAYAPWAGIAFTLSGALKGPAYMIGRELFASTEPGEVLTGALRWGAAALIMFML